MQAASLARTSRLFSPRLHHIFRTSVVSQRAISNMTTAGFKYIEPSSYANTTTNPSGKNKPWGKVDGAGTSYELKYHDYPVENFRGHESDFGPDVSGFGVYHSPAQEKTFTDDAAVRKGYYAEVEALLRKQLPSVKKVVIFDHTIRRRDKTSPRQPVQQVHVDQTPQAAEVRVRRHLPAGEAEELLKGRYQIINVWRPIANPASDFPLAVVDWRSTQPSDFIKVDLLYPKRTTEPTTASSASSNASTPSSTSATSKSVDDDDDRGKETLPDPNSTDSTTGYEVKGETFAVAPSPNHKFFYYKDMTPDEAMFIKCFDSRSQIHGGQKGLADCTPHTAFIDPETPAGAPGRQSIEVRCLVFYE